MKFNLLILLVCLLDPAYATNYYFSSISGDDLRTSTQAQSSSTPWKTLIKLNSFFSNLQPGDSVLFKRGETFYGSITINKSGSTGLPVVFGAYGKGIKPVITSLVTFTNWVSKGNGIWESYNSSSISTTNMVLFNGVEQEMGRYPNSDATNSGYLVYESHIGKTSITDNELTSTIDWTGAELVTRPRRWIFERNLITSHTGSTISYTTSSVYEPYDKYGYFIQNSIKTLDKPGEWYYSPSTKKLSMYFGSGTPSASIVQATTITSLVTSDDFDNIALDNLTFKGSNGSGFNIRNGSNISITNCDILFSGEDGVLVANCTNLKIENCTVSNSNNNGIDFSYGVNYAVIRNSKVLNTSLLPGLAKSGDGNGIAICSAGNGNTLEYNEIRNTGYTSITFNGDDVTIKNNLIDSFCLIKDDGAGIYSNGTSVLYKNRKITGNIVMNGVGISNGTDNPSKQPVSGIYMDNEASAAEITGNTFANCNNSGIYIHNSAGMIVKNNTLFNNNLQLNFIQESDHPSSVRNNITTNNILFSKYSTQLISSIKSNVDDIAYFGKFDSNYYARPVDDRITIYNYFPGAAMNFDLSGWQNKYGKDGASQITAKSIAAYKVINLVGANKFANGLLTSTLTGVYASSCTILLGVLGLLDGGYLQVTPILKKSNVFVSIGGITAGKKYIVRYTVKGSADNNMVINTFLRLGVSPYSLLTPMQGRKVSITRNDYELIFIAPSTQSSVQAVFQADQLSQYYLDNIQVYEANAVITNPNDSIKFVYNATMKNKIIPLDSDYVDTKGNKFSRSITLLPYTTAILIRNGSTAISPPTVNIITPSNNTKFTVPETINISAAASDSDGTISKVEFLIKGKHLYTSLKAPYNCTWKDAPAGTYIITARATDNSGLTTTSAGITIVIGTSTLARGTVPSVDTVSKIETTGATIANTNGNSTMAISNQSLNNALGLNVSISPNPASNELSIFTSGLPQNKKLIISVFSMAGVLVKTIQQGSSNRVVQLNISSLIKGAYIVKAVCGDDILSQQFIKL